MLRQERNRDKEEKRKQRRLKPSTPGEPGEMGDADPQENAAANEAVVAREGSTQELADAAAASGSNARVSVP